MSVPATNIQPPDQVIWEPTPKQSEFLAASEREVLFGGAAGGGKTDALIIDALGLSLGATEYPRYRAILFRRSFPDLEDVIARSLIYYPQVFPGAVYNSTKHDWIFPSGAKVLFRTYESETDWMKYHGPEYQWIGWDELTLYRDDTGYLKLLGRNRCAWGELPCFVRATTNPGSAGHQWVKRRWRIPNSGGSTRFVERADVDGEIVRTTRAFIPSKLSDNPHLDEDYRQTLLQLPAKERRKLLDGRWDVVEGQYFEEFDPDVHVVKPFSIPLDWPRWRAMDWGYASPYSIGWYAQDFDGNIYRYRELYGWGGEENLGTREDGTAVARRVVEMEADEIKAGIRFRLNPADTNIWNDYGTGSRQRAERTIADQFREVKDANGQGVVWAPAKKGPRSRINGWAVMHERLMNSLKNRKTETYVGHGFYVFETCRHWIRTVPELQHSERDPEDVDTDMEDHAGDEARYSLVSRLRKPRQSEQAKSPRPGTMDWLTRNEKPRRPTVTVRKIA